MKQKKKTSPNGGLIGTLQLLNVAYKPMDLASFLQQQIQQISPYLIFSVLIKIDRMLLNHKPYIFHKPLFIAEVSYSDTKSLSI